MRIGCSPARWTHPGGGRAVRASLPWEGAALGSSTALGSGRVTHFGKCPAGTHLFCSSAERVNAILEGFPGVGAMERGSAVCVYSL